MTLSKRLDALTDAIKENRRIEVDKVTVIEVIGQDWIEIWDLEKHTQTRIYNHETGKQAAE